MDKIIILAAGKGTRMKSDLPKVLVPVRGRAMIEHLLDAILASGVDDQPLIVVSPENGSLIRSSLAGRNAEFVVQQEQLGTGHAVACALGSIGYCGKVLVFNGDHPFLRAETVRRLAQSDADIAMLTVEVSDFCGWREAYKHWGRIITEGDQVKSIVEFKDATQEIREIKRVNPGMYAFDCRWLKQNIGRTGNENAQHEFYLTDLIGLAFTQGKNIISIPVKPEEVIGINSPEDLIIAETIN